LRAEGAAPLVVGDLFGDARPVAACPFQFTDANLLLAFPGDAYPFVTGLDAKGFAVLQVTFAIVRLQLVEGQQASLAVDFDQVALEALAALMEADHQRIMVLLQQAQVGEDLLRCAQHLGWLGAFILLEGIGHGPQLRGKYNYCTSIMALSRYVPVPYYLTLHAWLSGRCWPILAAPPRLSYSPGVSPPRRMPSTLLSVAWLARISRPLRWLAF